MILTPNLQNNGMTVTKKFKGEVYLYNLAQEDIENERQ